MSALLAVIEEARDLRTAAERELYRAMLKAQDAGHSLREIGRSAGYTKTGCKWILDRERGNHDA